MKKIYSILIGFSVLGFNTSFATAHFRTIPQCDPTYGPMSLINGNEETVYNFQTDGCSPALNGNYSDVPVRPLSLEQRTLCYGLRVIAKGILKQMGRDANSQWTSLSKFIGSD